jgi:phosphoribosylformylglycinamidine (FGAM) synthase-like enzyme
LLEQNPHLIFLGSHGSFRRIDYEIERNMQALLIEAFQRGLIVAACVVNGDGILEALTKMIFKDGPRIRHEVDLTDCNHEDLLENAGRTAELESDYFLAAAEGWILEIADPSETYRDFIELAEEHMILAERDWINLNFVHEGNGLRIPVPDGEELRPFEHLYEAWMKPLAEIYP